MEAGCFRAVDADEAMDYGPSGAVDGPLCLSRPETQEGCTTATPPLFEEPSWESWGQEEASKLDRNKRRREKVFIITA